MNDAEAGSPPDVTAYDAEEIPVGEATVWLLGRDTNVTRSTETRPFFGLIDEASKINLNNATADMLAELPFMTTEFAAAIVDWRDTDSDVSDGGAEDEYYNRLNPAYRCKNADFETVEELRWVAGADLSLLFGEDTNLNGVLDPNEDDGDASYPADDQDGRLDSGLLEYVTVASAEPNSNGSTNRVYVANPAANEVSTFLQERFGQARATQLLNQLGNQASVRSVLEFGLRAGMTADEYAQVENDITVSTNTTVVGRVNILTAPVPVLAAIPGIGTDFAESIASTRGSSATSGTSLYWIVDVLGRDNAISAAPYLTTRGYQYTLDAAAVGHDNRGYQRVRFLIDTSSGTPRIAGRRDLTHLGWALGSDLRKELARRENLRR
ncbi:MAG: general secretion pathway protein GspK [Verrucomicrobiales bacterium]|nr:general secretion pathway protein GspK [Verrucomicrobiales bacterium]